MKLKDLLRKVPIQQVRGAKNLVINGISAHSKQIGPGYLFVAKKGASDDGSRYIPEAIQNGATAILSDLYDPSLRDVTQLIVDNVLETEALLSACFYGFPSQDLFTVGITGTNGKTTTAHLVKCLLDRLGSSCGLIGTISYILGDEEYDATRTTPDVETNHRFLHEMLVRENRSAVMEVTSHALTQGRVLEIDYDVAVFTNLSQDHLDYHKTMEEYALAKRKLFLQNPSWAVVNADDPWHTKILEGFKGKLITYGVDAPADLHVTQTALSSSGTEVVIRYREEDYPCSWPLVGRYNIYNCLAAMGVALCKGLSLEKIIPAMRELLPVPGRLEPVPNALGLKVYVDYAHSDDALKKVLTCLQEMTTGKIITVFGCGGDRDVGKRPKMAQICEKYSTVSIVTTDNPRSEHPEKIASDILKGFSDADHYLVELDRRKAIEKAISLATEEDVVLIAGKGHEPYQVLAHQTIPFDDRTVAQELCVREG